MYDLAAIAIALALLRGHLRAPLHPGQGLMTVGGDAFGLAISLLILVYLVYALFRGEKL